MGERRPTMALNWRVRIRAPRQKRRTEHDEAFERLEEQLRHMMRNSRNEEAAD